MHNPNREGPRLKLTAELIDTLSAKFVRRFLTRMPGLAHLREDLMQECAIVAYAHAERFVPGRGSLDRFLYTYARKAMQTYCSHNGGPVVRPPLDRHFSGSEYYVRASAELTDDFFGNLQTHAGNNPDEALERKQANEIVHDLIDRRAQIFSGKGKLSRDQIKGALTEMIAGDSCVEVAQRYGCSKQRMHMIADEAGIS